MEKCLLLYNPKSGKGKVARKEKYIVQRLSEKYEVSVCQSSFAGHITQIILEKGNDYEVIVLAGGDGTISEGINGIKQLGKDVKVGLIPTGTVNDIAHSLKIPSTIKGAVKNILNGKEFKHDVLKINDRYGLYVCCAGLFTDTSYATTQDSKKKMGKIAYGIYGLKKIFSSKALDMKMQYENGEISGKFALMMILNSRYVAGLKFNTKALLNDGLADVILVESDSDKIKFETVLKVAFLYLHGLKPKKKYKNKISHFQTGKFKIEIGSCTSINLDGEKACDGTIEGEVIKEGITIIVPNKNRL